jgi:hypothetical protein
MFGTIFLRPKEAAYYMEQDEKNTAVISKTIIDGYSFIFEKVSNFNNKITQNQRFQFPMTKLKPLSYFKKTGMSLCKLLKNLKLYRIMLRK